MKLTNKELKEYLNTFEEDAVVCIIPVTLEDKKVYKPQEILMMEADDEMEEQPELPTLKNNEQRRAFLESYRSWPVWFDVPQAEETYYRYILPDGSAIVICEYKQYVKWKEKYKDENPESIYKTGFLLDPGYRHLHDCRASDTELVKKLMQINKK